MNYTTTFGLIYRTKNFLKIHFFCLIPNLFFSKNELNFYGWGRKKSGQKAIKLAKKFNAKFTLLEDGFICCVDINKNTTKNLSLVFDDVGIYYDATKESKLEQLIENYDFNSDKALMDEAKFCIEFIRKFHISKYNNAKDIDENFIQKYDLNSKKNILIIAQTANDASLEFGLGEKFSTDDMIKAALKENINANILLKIHPDVILGKKKSDIDIKNIDKNIKVISENINPISLLKKIDKVYTKTSGMGFEALILQKQCVCFGMPFYAGWGLSDDRISLKRRTKKASLEEVFCAAYLLYSKYINAYTNEPCTLKETLAQIYKIKMANLEKKQRIFAFGFSAWKHNFMRAFFGDCEVFFINNKNSLENAIKKGISVKDKVYIWGKKEFNDVQNYCEENNINITRVEDGFIRSVGLGCELTRPYSLVFDDKGIYFDTSKASALEDILNYHKFSDFELEEARKLKKLLLQSKISKYNIDKNTKISINNNGKKIILAIGQVQDDASILLGADGMSNLDFLKAVKKNSKDAYIIYKPHPDVLSGVRIGNIKENVALKFCDEISQGVLLANLLDIADEIHTMTSLTGLEALMRDKKVVCYGRAFWAGWGLSDDKQIIQRRYRKLSIDELIAGVYILYPRYIHPNNLAACSASDLVKAIAIQKQQMQNPKNMIKYKIYANLSTIWQKFYKNFKNYF